MHEQLHGRVGYGHPFMCRTWGCAQIVTWHDPQPVVGVGYCDAHRPRVVTVPISIWGHEHEGWCLYPLSLVSYLALREQGAFDESGRTRPFDDWRA